MPASPATHLKTVPPSTDTPTPPREASELDQQWHEHVTYVINENLPKLISVYSRGAANGGRESRTNLAALSLLQGLADGVGRSESEVATKRQLIRYGRVSHLPVGAVTLTRYRELLLTPITEITAARAVKLLRKIEETWASHSMRVNTLAKLSRLRRDCENRPGSDTLSTGELLVLIHTLTNP